MIKTEENTSGSALSNIMQSETSESQSSHQSLLGSRLQQLREDKNLSVRALTVQLGLPYTSYWLVERDKPRKMCRRTLETFLPRLAEYHGITCEELVRGTHLEGWTGYKSRPAKTLLGRRLQELRLKKLVSVAEAARAAGMSYSSLRRLETGDEVKYNNLKALQNLIEYYGQTYDELVRGTHLQGWHGTALTEFAQRIRRLRLDTGYSVPIVARRLEIKATYYSAIESNRESNWNSDVVQRIADVYGKSMEELTKGTHLENIKPRKHTALGDKLRELRMKSGQTWADVANHIGISRSYYDSLENGSEAKVSYKVITRLASLFRMTPLDLLSNTHLENAYRFDIEWDPSRPAGIQNLGELLKVLVAKGQYKSCYSRIAPTKTALMKYARFNGYEDENRCPLETIRKPLNDIIDLISKKADERSEHAFRNLRNNISYFVRCAAASGLIHADGAVFPEGRQKRPPRGRHYLKPSPYGLTDTELERATKFKIQLDKYFTWSTSALEAPLNILKRKETASSHILSLQRMAGYFVHVEKFQLVTLTLEDLVDIGNVKRFATWFVKRNKERLIRSFPDRDPDSISGVTRTLSQSLIYLEVLTRYYLKDQQKFQAIHDFRMVLPYDAVMLDKPARMISLQQLESVGKSVFPFNARKIRSFAHRTRIVMRRLRIKIELGEALTQPDKVSAIGWASRVGWSVLIRLLVRIPLRQRNIREMKLGKNLRKEGDKYILEFSGTELKVAKRRGQMNVFRHEIKKDGTGFYEALDEYLTQWRPFLIQRFNEFLKTKDGQNFVERRRCASKKYGSRLGATAELYEDHSFVFLNKAGTPISKAMLLYKVKSFTYRFTGKAVNPHLIRHMWATEYLVESRKMRGACDVVGAAFMLGDKIETVQNTYAHILDEQAAELPKKWLVNKLLSGVDSNDL